MNKASGGDGIPAELLQILKDDAVKMNWQSRFNAGYGMLGAGALG